MEKYDINPTQDNVISSIEDNVTGRNDSLYYLLRFLNEQDDSWSIAINGKWGSGKTFFVKQCQLMVDFLNNSNRSDNPNDIKQNQELAKALQKLCNPDSNKQSSHNPDDINRRPFRTVYYDAWEHDSEIDPIASLLQVLASPTWSYQVAKHLKSLIQVGAAIADATTKVNLSSMQQLIYQYDQDLETQKRRFSKELSKLAPESGKLIIFVDELDRCKPTYAVKLLERIKHYFTNPNVTFIFSVDLDQLQHTIKRYYGEQFAGYQYLDRFFDLVINLPEPDLNKYFENTKDMLQISKLFGTGSSNYYQDFCGELINHFSFSLRQINHFYLKANSASYNLLNQYLNYENENNHWFFIMYCFLLPLMIALNQQDVHEYNRFISGNASEQTLQFWSNSKNFSRYYIDISDKQQKDGITTTPDVLKGVKDIYTALFGNDPDNNDPLQISSRCYIENPGTSKNDLLNSCNLLSSTSKLS